MTIKQYSDRIIDPMSDPELKRLWDAYITLCNTPRSSIEAINRAFGEYDRAWTERRDRALMRSDCYGIEFYVQDKECRTCPVARSCESRTRERDHS